MALKSQGTRLYVIDPADDSVLTVGCVNNIDGIDTTIEQIDVTCLEDLARRFIAGLATPGSANFGIQFDPADESHVRLHQLKTAGTSLQWAVAFSDGTAAPTVHIDSQGDGEFVFPTTRSFLAFEGFMNSFPFSIPLNAVVTNNVGIQVSGEPTLHVKV